MSAEPLIQKMIDKFHRRMAKDEEAREQVMPVTKTINIDLEVEQYSMRIEEAQVKDFKPELIEDADILLKTTIENLEKIVDGTLRPMRAYVTKKIIIKGKIQDLLYLKKFM